eukprot:gene27618-7255_t
MAFQDDTDFYYPYSFISDQRLMLQDEPRMRSYRDAIFKNAASHFKGKAVLDVGTGSGILACWAAQAGARVVYAVEATGMAKHARTLAEANGLGDVITVIEEKMENVCLPEKVDTIISEWMGLLLLRDGMLPSVILARDKWLVPGGALFPATAQLWLAPTCYSAPPPNPPPASHEQVMKEWLELIENIRKQYGVDYSCLTSALAAEKDTYHLQSAIEDILSGGRGAAGGADDGWGSDDGEGLDCEFEELDGEEIGSEDADLFSGCAEPVMVQTGKAIPSRWAALKEEDLRGVQVLVKEIDVSTVKASDIEAFDCPFHLEMNDSCCKASGKPDSLTCWFDVRFPNSESGPDEEAVVLSTAPAAEPTHWGQQTFMLPSKALESVQVETTIPGSLRVFQLPTTHRMYGVLLSLLPSAPPSELEASSPDRRAGDSGWGLQVEYNIE